jgi:hypothetical protein
MEGHGEDVVASLRFATPLAFQGRGREDSIGRSVGHIAFAMRPQR